MRLDPGGIGGVDTVTAGIKVPTLIQSPQPWQEPKSIVMPAVVS